MTEWIDPLSQGSQLAIQRLHQQGEGRKQRATQRGIAGANIRGRSSDYAALRDMRERMQMKDLDAQEQASQRIMAQMERKRSMQQRYLQYFLDADATALDEIDGISRKLDKSNLSMLKAQILSTRDKAQWQQVADQLRGLRDEEAQVESTQRGFIQGASERAFKRFSGAEKGFLMPGQPQIEAGKTFGMGEMFPMRTGSMDFQRTMQTVTGPMAPIGIAGKLGARKAGRFQNNYFMAQGLAKGLLAEYRNLMPDKFGPNSGKAEDTLSSLYFSLLSIRPDQDVDNYLKVEMQGNAQDHYGVKTYGELLDKSLRSMQDDLGMPLSEVRMLIEEPGRALERATGQRTYRDFLSFHGGSGGKANKQLGKILGMDPKAIDEFNFPEMFEAMARMDMIADVAGVPKGPSVADLEDLTTWMEGMIRSGGNLDNLKAAPGRFDPNTLAYGEELLGQLGENMPQDYNRGVVEMQLQQLMENKALQGEMQRSTQRRENLPMQAMGEIFE